MRQVRAIEARLRTAADFLSNTGLCRLEPPSMDRLQLRPGDYIRIRRTNPEDQTTPSIIARSWLRCGPFQEDAQHHVPDPHPAIQLDPMLAKHLGAQVDEVLSVMPCRKVDPASTVTLVCNMNLTEDDRKELERVLKFKGWPLFRGALYALRYGDDPLVFQVKDDLEPPSVLGVETMVTFATEDDLAQLQRTAQIARARAELEACTLRRKALEQEREGLQKNLKPLQEEQARLQGISKNLAAEEKKLENPADSLLTDEETRRKQIHELQQRRQQLQNNLDRVVYPDLADLDLNAAQNRLEQARTELRQALDAFIQHLSKR